MTDDHRPDPGIGADVVNVLTTIGKLRDGLLVVGAAAYASGYLVWSYTAWREGLGLLPALSLQYFVAGTPIAVAIALWFAGREVVRALFVRYMTRHVVGTTKYPWMVAAILGVLAITLATLLMGPTKEPQLWRATLAAVVLTLILYVAESMQAARGLNDEFPRWMQRVLASLLVFIAFYAFATIGFKLLPQEFGGARPRCAALDVAADQLSESTLTVLGVPTPGASGTGARTARTARLDTLVSPGSSLNVRGAGGEVASLDRTTVRSVLPCDYSTMASGQP